MSRFAVPSAELARAALVVALLPCAMGLAATPGEDLDASTPPPPLVGSREDVACRFTASDGFDDGPPPQPFDLRAAAQDASLHFAEIGAELAARMGKPPSGEAVAQAIENALNSPAHHRKSYWRRRRARLLDHRRIAAEAVARVFQTCGHFPAKTVEVAAACERLVVDRQRIGRELPPEALVPAKLDGLEKEVREVALAAAEAANVLKLAAGQPFFELEKVLKKQFDAFDVVVRARSVFEGRRSELQEKLTHAEAELYRLEDETHRNTEEKEDALEETIEDLRKQIERLNAADDVKLEAAFTPPSWRDSAELRAIKADKKVKAFLATHAARYQHERTKYRAITDQLDLEGERLSRIAKFDPSAAFSSPRLTGALLERGDELPVVISYVIEADWARGRKPEVVSTTLLCGKKKKQEGFAFAVSWTPPRPAPPPPPRPAPAPKGGRTVATAPAPKAPRWPSPTLQTRAAERAGIVEAIECNTWTIYCDKIPVANETAPSSP
jgi:hypothetical protein